MTEYALGPWQAGLHAGIDEVGIGPLAGPVVAAAVLLDPNRPIAALQDSKMLSPARREDLALLIQQRALDSAVGWASVAEVDELNILRASHVAMQRAFRQLSVPVNLILIDGNKTPCFDVPSVAVVKGDKKIPQISAASILAKVSRDAEMVALDLRYPEYGFAKHKGYPTKAHLAALAVHGVTPHHRRSFGPVRHVLGINEAQREAR